MGKDKEYLLSAYCNALPPSRDEKCENFSYYLSYFEQLLPNVLKRKHVSFLNWVCFVGLTLLYIRRVQIWYCSFGTHRIALM